MGSEDTHKALELIADNIEGLSRQIEALRTDFVEQTKRVEESIRGLQEAFVTFYDDTAAKYSANASAHQSLHERLRLLEKRAIAE